MKGLVMKATTTRSERQCIVGSFGSSISEDWRKGLLDIMVIMHGVLESFFFSQPYWLGS
jgi:hypothetical protein